MTSPTPTIGSKSSWRDHANTSLSVAVCRLRLVMSWLSWSWQCCFHPIQPSRRGTDGWCRYGLGCLSMRLAITAPLSSYSSSTPKWGPAADSTLASSWQRSNRMCIGWLPHRPPSISNSFEDEIVVMLTGYLHRPNELVTQSVRQVVDLMPHARTGLGSAR
jgi:hypothetical protein